MRKIKLALLAASGVAAVNANAATDQRIGTAAVAKNQVSGTLGSAKRTLTLGDGVFQNENIVTGGASSAQILFADETALNMGPNSEVLLDKFIYDPSKRKGELALRAVTGSFRFVSGSGPKDGYRINTPVGTIGVRGTTLEFVIRGRSLMLALTEGATTLCTMAGKCVHLTVPGTYVVTNGDQLSDTKSKYGRDCGAGGVRCNLGAGSDSLYLDYLGLTHFRSDIAPSIGPGNPAPGNGPPPPGPTGGFPPITTPSGFIPQGLQGTTLPPGLANNRGPNFEPPGHARRGR